MIKITTKKNLVYHRQEVWFNEKTDPEISANNNIFLQSLVKQKNAGSFTTCNIDLCQNKEEIFGKFSSNTKNEIRRGQKEGVMFKSLNLKNSEFVSLFKLTYSEWAISKGRIEFDSSRLNAYILSESFVITSAIHNDTLIVYHSYLFDENRCRLITSHHNINYLNPKMIGFANRYLHWEDILFFKEKGLKYYDFGGLDKINTPGIAKFKLGFGPIEEVHYNFNRTRGTYNLFKKLSNVLRR